MRQRPSSNLPPAAKTVHVVESVLHLNRTIRAGRPPAMLSNHQLSPHMPPLFAPEPLDLPDFALPSGAPVAASAAFVPISPSPQPMSLCASPAQLSAAPTPSPPTSLFGGFVSPTAAPKSPIVVSVGLKRPATPKEAPTGVAAKPRPSWKRVLSKPDGRCCIRSVLHGCGAPLPAGIHDILNDDSTAARLHIKEVRERAAAAVKAKMAEDEELQMIVGADFPDEFYEDFDSWAEAMALDDTEHPTSCLWRGGGQWLLYGLGLVFELRLAVVSMYPDLFEGAGHWIEGGSQDVVAAGERVVRLAMMHDDEGMPDHFDVLEEWSVQPSPALGAARAPGAAMLMVEQMPRLDSEGSDSDSGRSAAGADRPRHQRRPAQRGGEPVPRDRRAAAVAARARAAAACGRRRRRRQRGRGRRPPLRNLARAERLAEASAGAGRRACRHRRRGADEHVLMGCCCGRRATAHRVSLFGGERDACLMARGDASSVCGGAGGGGAEVHGPERRLEHVASRPVARMAEREGGRPPPLDPPVQ